MVSTPAGARDLPDLGRLRRVRDRIDRVGRPGTSLVLHPPAADPGITDEEPRTIAEMMSKGTYASIN